MKNIIVFLMCLSFIPPSYSTPDQLSTKELWYGTNRHFLNTLISQYGTKSSAYNALHKPVAAFDWDNTMMKNDIGEATLLWMVSHGLLKRPKSFSKMNPWLTTNALKELAKNCDGNSSYLPTHDKPLCADSILNIYHNLPLENGTASWKASPDPERIFPPYFFYAQLFAGYTPEEISKFTTKALEYNLSNKIGATQKVGSKNYPAYVRIYTAMKNLVSVLQHNGFDVWIISASIQPSVEVVAAKAGISKDHVIGIRQMLDNEGKITDSFQGCGTFPDGNKQIISNRLGKRCWLNKVVFKLNDSQQLHTPTPIIFAAGDSAGDLVFLKDARGGKLVINKNNPELLCHVFQNTHGKWIINPMFINPVPLDKSAAHCRLLN